MGFHCQSGSTMSHGRSHGPAGGVGFDVTGLADRVEFREVDAAPFGVSVVAAQSGVAEGELGDCLRVRVNEFQLGQV